MGWLSNLSPTFNFDQSDKKYKSNQTNTIWGPQAGLLEPTYTGTTNLLNNNYINQGLAAGEAAIPGIEQYGGQALPVWSNLLAGGAFGGQSYDTSGLNPMATGNNQNFQTLYGLQNPQQNPYLNAMAQSGLGQMFRQYQQSMAQNKLGANFAGGLGGSRQGVADANANYNMMMGGSDFLSSLYGGQYQSDMNRAMQSAQIANQQQLQAMELQRLYGYGADQTSMQALGQGANAMNLGFASPMYYQQLAGMQFSPYQWASEIAGSPYTSNVSSKGSASDTTWGFGLGAKA